jgi:hypothetical protein
VEYIRIVVKQNRLETWRYDRQQILAPNLVILGQNCGIGVLTYAAIVQEATVVPLVSRNRHPLLANEEHFQKSAALNSVVPDHKADFLGEIRKFDESSKPLVIAEHSCGCQECLWIGTRRDSWTLAFVPGFFQFGHKPRLLEQFKLCHCLDQFLESFWSLSILKSVDTTQVRFDFITGPYLWPVKSHCIPQIIEDAGGCEDRELI